MKHTIREDSGPLMRVRVTMADIARLAGVAPSTVSRALNGSPLVNEETRERIQALAKDNGYQVNATASNLRRQEAGALGLVAPISTEVSDPFLLQMIGSVAEAATLRGYDLLLTLANYDGGQQIGRRELLATGRVDGLVVIGQGGRQGRLNELSDAGAAMVVWGARVPDQRYVTVGSDNRLGGRLATEHLLQLGRRRILFLGDPQQPEVENRLRGYRAALHDAGLDHAPELARKASFVPHSALVEMRRVLAEGVSFDAVVAASDVVATEAIRALGEAGRRVPEDVAVVGYDDVPLAGMMTPALTTVSQDVVRGGQRLVELLLDFKAGRTIEREFTETILVVRGSCGGSATPTS